MPIRSSVAHLSKISLLIAAIALSVAAHAQVTWNLNAGWNLLGNSSAFPIDVAATFGNPEKIKSVWAWHQTTGKWAFYAPSTSRSDLSSYAQSRGYEVLTSIFSKEGFWVNASVSDALTGPAADSVSLTESDLQVGWNLVSSADNKSPSQLNQALGSSLNAAGKSMQSAWAWDKTNSNWKFFSPSLEAQGGTVLTDYINSKGYLPFDNALVPSEGYWLNIQARDFVAGPIKLLVSGQSNAVSPSNEDTPIYSATGHVWVNDYYCERSSDDPCWGGMEMIVPIKGHTIHANQVWIILGDELFKMTGRDVYIYNIASGGRATDFFLSNYWLPQFKNILATKPDICANLWIQGESEEGYSTQQTYNNMHMIVDTSRTIHPALPWFVALDAFAREAQQRLITEGIVYKGADIDLLRATPSYFQDNLLEFKGEGHRAHAFAWLEVLQGPISRGMCPE